MTDKRRNLPTPEPTVLRTDSSVSGGFAVVMFAVEREFDEMVERMQRSAHRAAVDALFAGQEFPCLPD